MPTRYSLKTIQIISVNCSFTINTLLLFLVITLKDGILESRCETLFALLKDNIYTPFFRFVSAGTSTVDSL